LIFLSLTGEISFKKNTRRDLEGSPEWLSLHKEQHENGDKKNWRKRIHVRYWSTDITDPKMIKKK